ncbi:MAG: LysM peptidoglycan-binding domain-containing protein [Hyphomicrobiales bacterium]|nr:LysM peptidoglycan-binding domain-containing protein [Hyphomicrobiales bacterium]
MSSKAAAPIGGVVAALVAGGAYLWQTHQPPIPNASPPATIAATSAPAAMAAKLAPATSAPASPAPVASAPALPSTPPAPAAMPLTLPSFDVVRVTPQGETLVAGRGQPGAEVSLMDGTKMLAQGKIDANGQFVLMPSALPEGTHALTLSSRGAEGGEQSSKQSVVVNMAQADKGGIIIALAEPGKPTRILSGSQPVETAAAAPKATPPAAVQAGSVPVAAPPSVAIQAVEVEKDGAFYVTGNAPTGAQVRVYLNDSMVASVTSNAQGHWSMKILKGVPPGSLKVRADEVTDASGKVLSRAEVPFQNTVLASSDASPAGIQAATPSASTDKGAGASKSDVVVSAVATATVVRGDSLWRISRKMLGQGIRYTTIYAANAKQIRNPSLIYPGQVFVVPQSPS